MFGVEVYVIGTAGDCVESCYMNECVCTGGRMNGYSGEGWILQLKLFMAGLELVTELSLSSVWWVCSH
ncbi:hypothetical protein C5167_006534 [Papaver somniferum]|uniref:Uncharacterized protein n=1 Tax=Papaver somniferum TaxID=3469 RepID=A0A4Y7JGR3_PAPSO|nr:hypothetical protein C5167_006534 [Papaver somniferum]